MSQTRTSLRAAAAKAPAGIGWGAILYAVAEAIKLLAGLL